MSFTSPFNHKCPICSRDLYRDFQDKLFLNAFRMKKFKCANCNKLLSWKLDRHLLMARYGFSFAVCVGICFPVFSYFFGVISISSLILMGSGAISSILALISTLRMQVIKSEV